MAGLLILVLVGAVLAAYVVDRGLKTRVRARRLRGMSERLDSAALRAEEQQEKRQAVAQASSALTSFMPAIKQPPLSVPDTWQPASATSEPAEQQEQPARPEAAAQAEQAAGPEAAAQAEQTAELEPVGQMEAVGQETAGQETAGWQERTARLELPGQPERGSGHAGHRPARPGAHPPRPADRATQR